MRTQSKIGTFGIGLLSLGVISGLCGSASAQSFNILGDYSDMNVQRLITFDNLTAGQVLTVGDLIETGVTFGFNGIGENFEALVIDQGNGDLALQMTIDASVLQNASAIGLVFDTEYSAMVATWQRASGSNNFDGGLSFGNPGSTLYEADGQGGFGSVWGASQSPPSEFQPYTNDIAYPRGLGSDNGGTFSAVRWSISSSGSDSVWIIDDVAVGFVPTPGAAGLFVLGGLVAARRRR